MHGRQLPSSVYMHRKKNRYCVISQGQRVTIIETRCDRDIGISMQYFGLRIGVSKYALQAYTLSPTRMPSRTPSLNLSAILLFPKMRES